MPTLHINLLGDFLLKLDDTPITTVTLPRLQSLLAYLVLHQNVPQDRSHLAFLLWPINGSTGAYQSAQITVSIAASTTGCRQLHPRRQTQPTMAALKRDCTLDA